jgi:hypothetical protein
MATAAFSDSWASTAGAAADLYARRFHTAAVSVSSDRYSFVVHSAYALAYFRHVCRGPTSLG